MQQAFGSFHQYIKQSRLFCLLFSFLFVMACSPLPSKKHTQDTQKLSTHKRGTKKSKDSADKLNRVQRKSSKQNMGDGLTTKVGKRNRQHLSGNEMMTKTAPKRDTWLGKQSKKIRYTFCPSCVAKDLKTDCPAPIEKKKLEEAGEEESEKKQRASVTRSTYTIPFDVIKLEDIRLDIPAFKQFKNNMTDFTQEGDAEFQKIIEKIGTYLGTNYQGEGVTLQIIGGASQIPTSFDPDFPNNNIRGDGSSIPGKTSIANNKKLAMARATELAKKIKAVFKNIEIRVPTMEEISIGETPWTAQVQAQLNAAVKRKDKAAIAKVYAPFQKDQFVKVESKDKASRSIQPNALKMYMLSTSPALKIEDKEYTGVFIISKKTYDQVGEPIQFETVEARDAFLYKQALNIRIMEKPNGSMRMYMLNGSEEMKAFDTPSYETRIRNLFHLDIIDSQDEKLLESWIIEQYQH